MQSNWWKSQRDARFNPDWERTRKRILERDHHMCQWPVTDWNSGTAHICGRLGNEVDHKQRAGEGEPDNDDPSNLWTLCSWHHKQKTSRESGEARRLLGERRRRERWYSHPAFQ
ncbi:HNH endonuclease [Bifidobacterium oedipodis]|uniref:HNH endonuclease n=1 Tax=Bifidobacterium oedipodis TaxID=2675322 RepID=A0A7Y0EQ04_9BIFI|nr:HNH endonuclease [Bifidobacterium sp. DSM 109957]NMM93883.1 HNH endonuclease [Bifidobacterium sp. DSM 109957]